MSWFEREIKAPRNLNRWKRYRKFTLTEARLATPLEVRRGITSREGAESLHEGDYIGRDELKINGQVVENNWPIPKGDMEKKRLVGPSTHKGYSLYESTGTVRAKTILWPFWVNNPSGQLRGRIGDKAVVGEENQSMWVVKRRIFKKTYSRVA